MPILDHERLTHSFFRGVNSAPLFMKFFERFGVLEGMGLTVESSNDDIYAAWEDLECDDRDEIREDLCRINDIARERGRFTLLFWAEKCVVKDYADLTLPKLAMVLYLDHRSAFDRAYSFFMLEKTDNLHTLLGHPPVPCNPSEARVEQFRQELRKALRKETVGPQVKVEVEGRHPDKWMAAIPHQNYVKPDHVFEGDDIVTQDRRPVYEMVLIYYPDTGLLKLKAGRGRRKVERVAKVFAQHILGQSPDYFEPCEIVKFGPLVEDGFSFAREPGDHFEWVKPVQIRYAKNSDPGTDYLVHLKDMRDGHPGVLHTVAGDGINLSEVDIKSLFLCFKFPKNKRDTRTVELTRPSRVSLDETDRDRYIEEVLVRWRLLDHDAKARLASAGVSDLLL